MTALLPLDGSTEAIAAYLRAERAWLAGDLLETRRATVEALAREPGPETTRRAQGFLRLLAADPVALVAGVAVAALAVGLLAGGFFA